MKQCKVGILGATGAVGQEMLKILQEYWPAPEAQVKRSSSTAVRS